MTSGASARDELSGRVRLSLLEALRTPQFSHQTLLATHLQSQASGLKAAELCLSVAESAGQGQVAMAAAEAVACLEAVASILAEISIEASSSGSVMPQWGMPRTLNAGDAAFALAHQRLLGLRRSMNPEMLTRAINALDTACLELAECLSQTLDDDGKDALVQTILYSLALRLADVLAGHSDLEQIRLLLASSGLSEDMISALVTGLC